MARYLYTQDGQPLPEPIRVDEDWSNKSPRAQTATEELVYGNLTTLDGTPINSRKKRREYMKARGLADADDFSDSWRESLKREREAASDRHLTQSLGRAVYEHLRGSKL